MNLYVLSPYARCHTDVTKAEWRVRPAHDDSSNPVVYTSHTNVEDEPSIDQIRRVHPVSPTDAVNGNKQ